jgi:hypothetical protein
MPLFYDLHCAICAWGNAYDDCIVINPMKSNYITFNIGNINICVNGCQLVNSHLVKYLGIYIDDKLNWESHVEFETIKCCERIGVFKKSVIIYKGNCLIVL